MTRRTAGGLRLLIAAAGLLFPPAVAGSPTPRDGGSREPAPVGGATPIERVRTLVDRLSPAALADAATAARVLAIGLAGASEVRGTRGFARHEARDFRIDGIAVAAVDLRNPRPGGSGTAGPTLVLTLERAAGACIPEREVLRAFPGLEPDGASSPHAGDPDAYRSRATGRTRLSFGFPYFGPDCLRTIVYSVEDPS